MVAASNPSRTTPPLETVIFASPAATVSAAVTFPLETFTASEPARTPFILMLPLDRRASSSPFTEIEEIVVDPLEICRLRRSAVNLSAEKLPLPISIPTSPKV